MLILSNGLTDTADEGFLKVATSLIKRLKLKNPKTMVISYERKSDITDRYIELNKLLLNKELFTLLRKNNDSFLYIPFPARMIATALRVFILSLLSKQRVNVLLVMKNDADFFTKIFLKISKANIMVLSEESADFYRDFLPNKKVQHIKAGVDTDIFTPVSTEVSKLLKIKYGFNPEKPIILHVGHLNEGRNIAQLMKINPEYQVLLVTSTLTKNEQNEELKKKLLDTPNIRIIDKYIPSIKEVYQLSDVYFFPVIEPCNCIDIPLSCLEAAACNLPVITTSYGAMKEFKGKKDFYFINSFENINEIISQVLTEENVSSRKAVLEYDWENAACILNKLN